MLYLGLWHTTQVLRQVTRIYLQTMDCVYDASCVCKSRRPMTALHLSHLHPSFWRRIEHCPTPPKFLIPEKSGTRMHGTRLISGTRNLGGELGSCAIGLSTARDSREQTRDHCDDRLEQLVTGNSHPTHLHSSSVSRRTRRQQIIDDHVTIHWARPTNLHVHTSPS